MQVSYEWLKDYVALPLSPEELAERLTAAGVMVDAIHDRGKEISDCVVGKVVATTPHPNADRLIICQVALAVDGDPVQIVTGATNVGAGAVVPVALAGATLPGGKTIEPTEMRGIASMGMLLSADELGMIGVYPDGILILPDDAPLGVDAAAYLGLRDPVFELDLTPNYAHCLSMIGVAHEVAAIIDGKVNWPQVGGDAVSNDGTGAGRPWQPGQTINAAEAGHLAQIEIAAPDLCSRYSARIIADLKVGPSPLWLQRRLEAAGVRPISNVVDVTNYVMLELGQPLHAFDYDKLHGSRIVVRRAAGGEWLTTLDGVERQLDPEMLVIADADHPVGLAGVMGGFETEVTPVTRTILLESAQFSGPSIRRTSLRLGLRSEASLRFEKGFDPNGTLLAADRCAYLLELIGAGRAVPGCVDINTHVVRPRTINLRPSRVEALLGLSFSRDKIAEILTRLDFAVADGGEPMPPFRGGATVLSAPELPLSVTVPTRRVDIEGEVDLIEEIARQHGYHHIATTPLAGRLTSGGVSNRQTMMTAVRDWLADVGLSEIVSYSFVDPGFADRLAIAADDPLRRAIPITNPMTGDRSLMRTTLLPGMLGTLAYNQARRNLDAALFELKPVYRAASLPLTELPDEPLMLGIVLAGQPAPTAWNRKPAEADFYDVKGLVDGVLAELGIGNVTYRAASRPTWHPGRQAEVLVGDECVGIIGELHPAVVAACELRTRVITAELDFDILTRLAQPAIQYAPLPKTPAQSRDLALVLDSGVPVAEVEAAIRAAAGESLESVSLFDVYQGEHVGTGRRSLAFTIVYRAADRPLSDADVEALQESVRKALAEKLGAELRS